jgi:thiamine-monophosphate kinase
VKEFELLNEIYARSTELGTSITIGPGDDMGELVINDQRLLVAVDQLVVGRHVTIDTAPELIGRKAIARCFSDIAAMAGAPIGSLMTACLPAANSEFDESWAMKVFEGAREAALQWGGPIFGGDIATCADAPPIFSVTAVGTPPTSGAITRAGSQEGDHVCVTGTIGNSQASHHLTFAPRIKEAQELLRELQDHLHAMIDVSDGLGRDASHLASNERQIVIDTASIPLRDGATIETALCDGEDYELLFTTSKIPTNELVAVIGKVANRANGSPSVIDEQGTDLSAMGWQHA